MPQVKRIDPSKIMIPLPFIQQRDVESCGPATLMSVFSHFNVDHAGMEQVRKWLKTDKMGTHPNELLKVARRCKLNAKLHSPMSMDSLRRSVSAGRPVICAVQAYDDGHYIAVVGYDRSNIYFMDPLTDGFLGYRPNNEFLAKWHDEDRLGRKWERLGIVVWRNRHPYMRRAILLN